MIKKIITTLCFGQIINKKYFDSRNKSFVFPSFMFLFLICFVFFFFLKKTSFSYFGFQDLNAYKLVYNIS